MNVARIYKDRLKDLSVKCRKKMEGECLSLIETHLKGRVIFKAPKIAGNQEYRARFQDGLKSLFD
jgi:hypothetical protein